MKRSLKRTTAIAPRREALRTIAMAHDLRSAALARVIDAFVGTISRRIDRAMARVVSWMNRHPAWT